jgi:hypothetical protein
LTVLARANRAGAKQTDIAVFGIAGPAMGGELDFVF